MAKYGLGAMGSSAARGSGLSGLGTQVEQSAMGGLQEAAQQETQRNISNDQMEQQRHAGNVQLGATAGALAGMQWGSAAGPYGALIGAVAGGLAGSLF